CAVRGRTWRDAAEEDVWWRRDAAASLGGALWQEAVDALEQLIEDPGRRAPDEVLAEQVGVGFEGEAATRHLRARPGARELCQRQLQNGRDLARRDLPPGFAPEQADERVDQVVGHERRRRGP